MSQRYGVMQIVPVKEDPNMVKCPNPECSEGFVTDHSAPGIVLAKKPCPKCKGRRYIEKEQGA